jgi:hypothetical protein
MRIKSWGCHCEKAERRRGNLWKFCCKTASLRPDEIAASVCLAKFFSQGIASVDRHCDSKRNHSLYPTFFVFARRSKIDVAISGGPHAQGFHGKFPEITALRS